LNLIEGDYRRDFWHLRRTLPVTTFSNKMLRVRRNDDRTAGTASANYFRKAHRKGVGVSPRTHGDTPIHCTERRR
jgi:hypothetical protein